MASKQTRNTLVALIAGGATIPALTGCGDVLVAAAMLESSRVQSRAQIQAAQIVSQKNYRALESEDVDVPDWVNDSPYERYKGFYMGVNKEPETDRWASLYVYPQGIYIKEESTSRAEAIAFEDFLISGERDMVNITREGRTYKLRSMVNKTNATEARDYIKALQRTK